MTDTPKSPEPLTAVFVVERSREYEGSDVMAIFTDEQEARRHAFDEQQGAWKTETYSVTRWSGGPGKLTQDYQSRWYPPKKPTEPKEPREYVEAKERYAAQLAEYEEGCKAFA